MVDTRTFDVELVEKQLVDIELSQLDLIYGVKTNISSPKNDDVLIYKDGIWINSTVSILVDTYAVHSELPTIVSSLPSKRFQTEYSYRSETLQVFLNGMKIHDSEITKHSDTEFSYPINIITSDKVEVAYIKK